MAKLLVIEKTAEGRSYLSSLARDCGHEVLEACEPENGLEIAEAEHPDLILTNAFLGSMDAYDLVRRLRADSSTKATPVILFASARDEWLARAIARACDIESVIGRAADSDSVITAIRAALPHPVPEASSDLQSPTPAPKRRAAGG
jgi:CheY-like chemotaxis protein